MSRPAPGPSGGDPSRGQSDDPTRRSLAAAGALTLLMAAEGYGGEAKGRIDFHDSFPFRGRSPRGRTSGTSGSRSAPGCARHGPPDDGNAERRPVFRRNGGGPEKRDGKSRFHADERHLPLLESFLGFEKIDFSKVEGKASFRNGALKITQLTLTGEKLRCSLKGNIILADDFQDSRIDLNGTIEIPMQDNSRR